MTWQQPFQGIKPQALNAVFIKHFIAGFPLLNYLLIVKNKSSNCTVNTVIKDIRSVISYIAGAQTLTQDNYQSFYDERKLLLELLNLIFICSLFC